MSTEEQVKEKIKEIERFTCVNMGDDEFQAMTNANKSLVFACRRYFNWACDFTLSKVRHRQRKKSKRPRPRNYLNYSTASKPTVEWMINRWNASDLSQTE